MDRQESVLDHRRSRNEEIKVSSYSFECGVMLTLSTRPSTFAIRKRWGTEVVELLERMWQHDPADRPTMTDVKDDIQAILAEHKKNPKV
jgi:hypothetical protein